MFNIAIIDDGVNDECFKINGISEYITIENNNVIRNAPNKADKYSHGSVCAAILSKHIKNMKITSICLPYDESIDGYQINSLLTALNLCLSLEINILHLSLGVMDYSYYYDILKIINKIHKRGVLIIAACNKAEKITIPACFSNVLGVMYSPYVKNTLPFKFLDHLICGADVIVDIKEDIILKDGTINCFEMESSYAVPLICSEVAKALPNINNLQEIKNKYGIRYEKSLDWMENPLILIISDNNVEIFNELIMFDNYHLINLIYANLDKELSKLKDKLKDVRDIIIIDYQSNDINIYRIKNEIRNLVYNKNVAICVDDDSFSSYILENMEGRMYLLTEMSKKTLIQNKPSCDITISWKLYREENEVEYILLHGNNTLFLSCETIHILYGIEYIPKSIQKSKTALYKYVSNMAYVYNLDAVCILKKEIL